MEALVPAVLECLRVRQGGQWEESKYTSLLPQYRHRQCTYLENDDRKKYPKLIEKFNTHFKVQCNVIFERAQFNKFGGGVSKEIHSGLVQPGQDVWHGTLKEEVLQDRLLVGFHDTKVSETLQMSVDLTLDKPKMSFGRRSRERTDSAAAHSGQQECWRGQDSRPQRSKNAPSCPQRYQR